jgi:hypothetical protein
MPALVIEPEDLAALVEATRAVIAEAAAAGEL